MAFLRFLWILCDVPWILICRSIAGYRRSDMQLKGYFFLEPVWAWFVLVGFSWYFFGISWYFSVFRTISGYRRSGVQLKGYCFWSLSEHDFFSLDFHGIFWYFLIFLNISYYFWVSPIGRATQRLVFSEPVWTWFFLVWFSWYFLVFLDIS